MTTATELYINTLEGLLERELQPSQINACRLAIIILKYLSEGNYFVQDMVEDLGGMIPADAHAELLTVFNQKDIMSHASDLTVHLQGRLDQPKRFAQAVEAFLEEHKEVFNKNGTASIEIQQPMTRH